MVGRPEPLARTEIDQPGGDPVDDRLAVGVPLDHPEEDRRDPEGDDEGVHPHPGDGVAVDQADEGADGDGGEHDADHRPTEARHEPGTQDLDESGVVTHREVELAADEGDHDGQGQDADDRLVAEDVLDVGGVGERTRGLRPQAEEDEGDDEQHDQRVPFGEVEQQLTTAAAPGGSRPVGAGGAAGGRALSGGGVGDDAHEATSWVLKANSVRRTGSMSAPCNSAVIRPPARTRARSATRDSSSKSLVTRSTEHPSPTALLMSE